jgi:hypothetical protein
MAEQAVRPELKVTGRADDGMRRVAFSCKGFT